MESIRTLVLRARFEMSLAALIPSIFGMRTSRRAMSGSFSWAFRTASWPSAASATTLISLVASNSLRRLWRNSLSSSATSTLMAMGLLLLLAVDGQEHRHGEAASVSALRPDPSPVGLGDELAIREPQAGSGLDLALIAGIKAVEDHGQILFGDAHALVLDAQEQVSPARVLVVLQHAGGDMNMAALRRELDGVAEQIDQQAREPSLVGHYRDVRRIRVVQHLEPLFFHLRPEYAQACLNQLFDRKGSQREGNLAKVRPIQIDHLIHHAGDQIAGAEQILEDFLSMLAVGLRRRLLQALESLLDPQQGVLEVVRDHVSHGRPFFFGFGKLPAPLGEFSLQFVPIA